MSEAPVALVTGGAQRVGAAICTTLHEAGFSIVLHYRSSAQAAQQLSLELNQRRRQSCRTLAANLEDTAAVHKLARDVLIHNGGVDLLVNNASVYRSTPIDEPANESSEKAIGSILGTNLLAPWLLSQALRESLLERGGAIVNLADSHSSQTTAGYSWYDISKNALVSLTRSLARELAPGVRVNAVAPGAILWPDAAGETLDSDAQAAFLHAIPMQRLGEVSDVAQAVLFLGKEASYMTGQLIRVDGGRGITA
jgi:pteridine reductase